VVRGHSRSHRTVVSWGVSGTCSTSVLAPHSLSCGRVRTCSVIDTRGLSSTIKVRARLNISLRLVLGASLVNGRDSSLLSRSSAGNIGCHAGSFPLRLREVVARSSSILSRSHSRHGRVTHFIINCCSTLRCPVAARLISEGRHSSTDVEGHGADFVSTNERRRNLRVRLNAVGQSRLINHQVERPSSIGS
jgi:hypothetical protein